MTAEPLLPPITCPSSLVASCGPLLGFAPENSLVAFIHGVPGRRSPVIMRVDLPVGAPTTSAARQTALSVSGTRGIAIDWVAWVNDEDPTTRDNLTSAAFVKELAAELDLLGIEVGANLSTNGRMWWSHTCTDPLCCPVQGTALDPVVMNAVRAEYVYAGFAPLGSREELAGRITRDEQRSNDVRQVMLRRPPAKPTQRWRDAQIRFLSELLLPQGACDSPPDIPMSAARAARVHRALGDIRVRDVVLHRLVVRGPDCTRCWESTTQTLCDVVRSAPEGECSPAATVLGLVAWLRGEGALATLCVRRALDEEPTYRLATLAAGLMSQGSDPRLWRESLATLPESECRYPGGRRSPGGR